MNCIFPSLNFGAKCTNCGYALRKSYDAAPQRNCGTSKQATQCSRLEGPAGEDVKQLGNCGCEGNRLTSVWFCELHDLCAPFARTEELDRPEVRACRFCADNTAGQTHPNLTKASTKGERADRLKPGPAPR